MQTWQTSGLLAFINVSVAVGAVVDRGGNPLDSSTADCAIGFVGPGHIGMLVATALVETAAF